MTTEEKAKAYDEALKDMMVIYPNLKGDAKLVVEHAFPELRESEDEIHRKWILEYLYDGLRKADEQFKDHFMSAIDWFKKQKEQKPVEKKITLTSFEEALNTFLFNFANSPIEDCEPKEYVKKYSAEILKVAYKELNSKLQQDIFEAQQEGRREGYEVAKAEQKPAVWSVEDEIRLKEALEVLDESIGHLPIGYGYVTDVMNVTKWLKSLRPSWKPSEEQMNCLCAAVDAAIRKHNESVSGYKPARVLKSLYEDLQKL